MDIQYQVACKVGEEGEGGMGTRRGETGGTRTTTGTRKRTGDGDRLEMGIGLGMRKLRVQWRTHVLWQMVGV